MIVDAGVGYYPLARQFTPRRGLQCIKLRVPTYLVGTKYSSPTTQPQGPCPPARLVWQTRATLGPLKAVAGPMQRCRCFAASAISNRTSTTAEQQHPATMGIQAPSAPGPQPHIPTKQTAIVQDASGQPTIVHDSPVPPLRPGTVLVKTVAVALNPSDFKMGSAFPSTGAVVGMDFAGYVVATMPSETASGAQNGIRVGDAVCGIVHGSNPADHESGSFAEYVLAPADLVLKVPPSFPLEAAATLGCALLTSCIALWSALGIAATPQAPAEEAVPVLVYGGSTASGTMAVQLLRL